MFNDGAKLLQQTFSCVAFVFLDFCSMSFDRLPFKIGLLKLSGFFSVLLVFEFFTSGKSSLTELELV